ncbi:MAG: type I-B CRISPR-associated protein Cas8b/Csh1, partial [Ignavibacteriales bacterium UTCHB3]
MNDRAVTAIGRVYKETLNQNGLRELWELYSENMFPGVNHTIISPVFNINRQDDSLTVSFSHVDIRECSEDSYVKYAYHKDGTRSGDITFTTKFGSFEDTTHYKNKKVDTILNLVIPKLRKLEGDGLDEEKEILLQVQALWREKIVEINRQLFDLYSTLDKEKKSKCGLSVVFFDRDEMIFPNRFLIIKEALNDHAIEGSKVFNHELSVGENAKCSICFEEKKELHGFASPFKYYTVDKRGYLANYFNINLAWKNYPVCSDCTTDFYLGGRFITNELSYSFYDRPFMAIPKLLTSNHEQMKKVVKLFKKYNSEVNSNVKLFEDRIMTLMAEQNNFFNVDLIFFERDSKTKAIKLKTHIEEIFPSRFRKIFVEARDYVDTHIIFKEFLTFEKEIEKRTEQKKFYRINFNFGKLLSFLNKEDYYIIYSVFNGTEISLQLLYSQFINKYRKRYDKKFIKKEVNGNKYYWREMIIDAMAVIYFLNYTGSLNIISQNYEAKMQQETEQKSKRAINIERLQEFIKENHLFFDKKYKVGIYLLGVLVRLVMNTQWSELKSTPFEKKLKGYKISGKDVGNIYVEALAKLQQYYDINAYGNLR